LRREIESVFDFGFSDLQSGERRTGWSPHKAIKGIANENEKD
jgi:hypothetical protein